MKSLHLRTHFQRGPGTQGLFHPRTIEAPKEHTASHNFAILLERQGFHNELATKYGEISLDGHHTIDSIAVM
jgi:hypothetical protein